MILILFFLFGSNNWSARLDSEDFCLALKIKL